jgi:predicted nuclease with TOPRIM domain
MDWTIILPSIVTAVLTYFVAIKRAKLKQSQVMAEIQSNAIKVVSEIESRLREELRKDFFELKRENEELRSQVSELKGKLSASDHLVEALKDEISSLKSTIELYRDEMSRSKKRLSDLESGNNNGH